MDVGCPALGGYGAVYDPYSNPGLGTAMPTG